MNTPSFIIALVILGFTVWGAWKAHTALEPPKTEASDEESKTLSEEDRTFYVWVRRVCLAAFAFGTIVLVQASGLFSVSDPLQGQDARQSLPTYSETPRDAGAAPQLDGVAMQPDLDTVVKDHQGQLDKFESD